MHTNQTIKVVKPESVVTMFMYMYYSHPNEIESFL